MKYLCKDPCSFGNFNFCCFGDDLNMRFYCKGICGGSASGKTTVARKIIEALNVQWVSLVSMDSFYKVTFID